MLANHHPIFLCLLPVSKVYLKDGQLDAATGHCTNQTRVSRRNITLCGIFMLRIDPTRCDRFLVSVQPRDVPDDDAAEGSTSHVNGRPNAAPSAEGAEEGTKRLSGAQRKKLAKEERKKHRGANKGRRFQKVRDEVELCFRLAGGKDCEFGSE